MLTRVFPDKYRLNELNSKFIYYLLAGINLLRPAMVKELASINE